MINEDDFKQAIIDLQFQEIGDLVEKALDSGILPVTILDGLKNGLDAVGDLYQTGELFLSELYMAGETMAAAMEVLTPALSSGSAVESRIPVRPGGGRDHGDAGSAVRPGAGHPAGRSHAPRDG